MKSIVRSAFMAMVTLGLGVGTTAPAMAAPDSPSLVICYTTGSVNVREAKKATESMLRVLETIGKWSEGTFTSHFVTGVKACERVFNNEKPHFIIPSLGFYLQHGGRDRLVPLAQPRVKGASTDTWRVMVRKGTHDSLDSLKGGKLGGTLVSEPLFLEKVVFRGAVKPEEHFKLRHSKRALRPLRDLAAGRLDAVLVNDQQFQALGSLPFGKDLEAVFTSKPLPLPGVFADTTRSSKRDRGRFGKAMVAFCGHPEGKSFCELFGIDGFEPVDPSAFSEVRALWNK
ncbi:MAG: PhnD/SsuA/transferrin family substrate-binding protein [Deltaproteobacteria bacterium]|nr:PhnD/SsuA/transferrin family substrate-binding protein [Deltaproteobacteria bacterium]